MQAALELEHLQLAKNDQEGGEINAFLDQKKDREEKRIKD